MLFRRRVGIVVGVGFLTFVAATQTAVKSADAQDSFEPVEIVSRDPVSNGPLELGANRSSISSLGDVVVFSSSTGREIRFRDRPNAATAPNPPIVGDNPGLSDDGCVIAYTGDVVFEFSSYLVRFDRCAGGSVSLVGETDRWPAPAPGLSADGTTIAWSRGRDVLIWREGADDIVVPAPNPGWLIGEVALSSDGDVIAFVSGPVDTFGFVRDRTQIWVADVPAGATGVVSSLASVAADGRPIGSSFYPTISADGTLIAFRGSNTVFVADRTIGFARSVVEGEQPSISRDGRYIAFEIFEGQRASHIFVVRSADRWTTISPSEFLSYSPPESSGFRFEGAPDVSEHGRWVSWSTLSAGDFLTDPLFPPGLGYPERNAILVRQRRPVLSVDPIAFGLRSSPSIRDTSVRNVGPSGWRVTSLETTGGPYQVVGQDCPAVLHPGDVCTVSVRYSPSGLGGQIGQLFVRDDSYPGVPLMASARLTGENDPPIDTTTTTTTTTIVVLKVGLSIAPDPIEFDSTIVASPAASREATVTNTGETSVTVDAVTISGAASGDYSIVLDGCTGTLLAVGGDCALRVGFMPSAAGIRTGDLFVAGTGGASASTTLRGTGEFDAQLSVTPEVVAPGQVATLVGSGFPPSTAIEVTLGEGAPVAVTTDGTGAFMTPWLVLGGSPQGELLGDDVAAISVYDADPAPLLVVGIPMRPQSTATRNRDIRSHVSR